MACIAVFHVTCLEVDESDEHGNEHALFVVLGQGVVQACGNDVGLETSIDQCAEHARNLSHEEGCGHSLATDIAHTEVEQIVD